MRIAYKKVIKKRVWKIKIQNNKVMMMIVIHHQMITQIEKNEMKVNLFQIILKKVIQAKIIIMINL